jgi:hypothetical protein
MDEQTTTRVGDARQRELGLEGATFAPRAVWEHYKNITPGWKEAWWSRSMREGLRAMRGNVPLSGDAGDDTAAWAVDIHAPWDEERDTFIEPEEFDCPVPIERAAATAYRMQLLEMLKASTEDRTGRLQHTFFFDWAPVPDRLYSCYVSCFIERRGPAQDGIQEFSQVIGLAFLSELVKRPHPDGRPLSEEERLTLADDNLQRLEGDPSALTAEETGQFWDALDAFLQPSEEASAVNLAEIATPIQSRVTTTREKRLLLDGFTRMDRRTDALIGLLDGRGLPRSWDKVARWDVLVDEEIRRLIAEQDNAAFQGAKPLLRKRATPRGDIIELTPGAKAALRDKAGLAGFREVVKDPDGVRREYLVKWVRRSTGYVEVRVSWYDSAWPMVPEACDRERIRAEALHASLASNPLSPTFWEELDERQREAAQSRLQWLQSIADARPIADILIRRFGNGGENPVCIPAHELRTVLGCEDEAHGFQRVKGALFALEFFRYHVKITGREAMESFGALTSNTKFTPGGAGDHKDGLFEVTLSDTAIGTLRVFKTAQPRTVGLLQGSKSILYDFNAPVSDKEAKLDYRGRDSMITPYFMRIAKLNSEQERLLRWAEWNITRNVDGVARGRRGLKVKRSAPNATDSRIYTQAFCPLLPAGEYVALLGHFKRGAECGFRLSSLMSTMDVSSRRDAIEAILNVAEKAFRGCAAVRYQNHWLRAEEVLGQSDAATSGNWFLFLPKGWVEAMHQSISDSSQYEVTRDVQRYRSASIVPYDPGTVIEGPNDPVFPLWSRMKKGRFDREMSQADLAKILGIPQPKISAWESKRKPIPASQVPKIEAWLSTIYPSPEG